MIKIKLVVWFEGGFIWIFCMGELKFDIVKVINKVVKMGKYGFCCYILNGVSYLGLLSEVILFF